MQSTLTARWEDGKQWDKIEIISILLLFFEFLLRLYSCFVVLVLFSVLPTQWVAMRR